MNSKLKKILIADREDSLRSLVRAVLESENLYQISEVGDGEAVFERIEENKPDLIILDIMMPVHSGFEICERIKQDSKTQDIQIIIFSDKEQNNEKKWS